METEPRLGEEAAVKHSVAGDCDPGGGAYRARPAQQAQHCPTMSDDTNKAHQVRGHRPQLQRMLGFALVLSSLLIGHSSFAQKRGVSVGEPPADHSPAAELASFKVLDGFEVNLFADETDGIPNPIAIRWDERGRLWVLQTSVYPQPKPDENPDDKIIILEDTDRDGRADKRTVFADGLCQPMGMELAPYQASSDQHRASGNAHSVYVGEGEKLWLFHDDDGDDRVDRREVVLSGFGTGDTHQNINSFVWSPDGALVMHQGLHCYSKVVTPHGTKTLYGAGFWHYRPRSGKLDAYPTGMPLNPWGTAFTNEGQPIMVAGAAGMFWARPMEISTADTDVRGSNESKSIPHFLLERFQLPYGGQCIKTEGLTKFCGVDIAGNTHWPESMQGELITGGFFENKVFRYKLRDDAEFPSGIEAIEQEALITSSNVAFRPIDIRFGPEGACYIADWYDPIIGHYQASFRHPNRDKAHGRIWRVVAKGRQTAAVPTFSMDVHEMIQDLASANRWLAYQTARLLRALPADQIEGFTSFEPIFLGKKFRPDEIKPDRSLPLQQARGMIEKPNWQLLAVDEQSSFSSVRGYAAWQTGNLSEQLEFPLEALSVYAADSSPRVRLEAVVAAGKVQQRDAIKVALKVLDKPMDSYIERALWLAVQATAKRWKPLALDFLKDMPPAHIAFLIQREGSTVLRDTATAMLKQADLPANVREGLTLALAKAETGDAMAREEAARLKECGNDPAKLEALAMSVTATARLRNAALAKFAKVAPIRAGRFAARVANDLKDLAAMKALLAPVLPMEAATKAMIEALKTKPCSADAAKLMLRVLTSTGRNEPELSAVLTGILGTSNTVPSYDPAWVSALAAEVKAKGDAAKGKTMFASTLTNCVACHSLAKQGGTIGPELDAVGRGVPMELIIEAVMWPNRQIKEGYIATNVVTKDGRRLQGYKVSDANGELQLRDFLGSGVTKLGADQIVSRQESGSLMPEGLAGLMTREELRDLVAYLVTLGS